jgi:hypothetical protein
MSLEDKILDPIVEATNSMMANGKLPMEVATLIVQQLKVAISEAQIEMRSQIEDKIHLWESLYGEKDRTLYTLGLRHSLDIINGEVATDKNGFNDKPYVEGQEFELDVPVEEI